VRKPSLTFCTLFTASFLLLMASSSRAPGQTGLAHGAGRLASVGAPQASSVPPASMQSGSTNGAGVAMSKPGPAARSRIVESYGKLPLSFEANDGQTDARVKFLSHGSGYTLFLTSDGAVLDLRKPGETNQKAGGSSHFSLRPSPLALSHLRKMNDAEPAARDTKETTTETALTMRLVGANPRATVTGTDELSGKTNYFIGNDPKKWRTNVPTYSRVKYHEVYPGVDVVYYGNQGRLEYDFVVAPGADLHAIKLALGRAVRPRHALYATRDPLRLAANGDLLIDIGGGEVRFHKPVVYQPATDNRQPRTEVEGHYRLSQHHVTFEVTKYDHHRPLIIDPVLSYSTYLGGGYFDQANAIAVDAAGNAYVTGITYSTNFPTTPGAFQPECQSCISGFPQAFVTKLNPSGSALVYSTFLNGTDNASYGYGIAVDTSGDAYVTGFTFSSNFPTTPGAFQPNCEASGCGAFVTELNPTGSGLAYSTYLGEANPYAITVDTSGDAYVTGSTESEWFPTTPGAFQTGCGDSEGDIFAFVSELNSTGSGLVYSTCLGGVDFNQGNAIAVDSSGNTYVTGFTDSSGFPTTPGAFQATDPTNYPYRVTFVTKINPGGTALLYSTYLDGVGPYNTSKGYGIAVDGSGDAYVTGEAGASDFPTTPGAFQTTFQPYADVFVTEFNSSGSTLVYSTFLGGSGINFGSAIALDSSGNAYVAGQTSSTSFPVTPQAFQTQLGGCTDVFGNQTGCDAFVSILAAGGSTLLYSTYLGGAYADFGFGIALDAAGNTYVAGQTYSLNFPTTAGAFQTSCGGACTTGSNGFIAKLSAGAYTTLTPSNLNFGNQTVGIQSTAQTVTLTNIGTAILDLTSIGVSGDNGTFTQTNTCGSTLTSGASCVITLSWAPSATGGMTGAITITDNAANSPQTVPLSGTGTLPAVTLSQTGLTFPTQVVFTTSNPQTVTLRNTGAGVLTISSIAKKGEFGETNTCGASVVPGASCTLSVSFRPTAKGSLNGTLTITDNAPGSPQTVTLQGTGTYAQLTPTSLNFGNQPAGTASLPQTITLSNKGDTGMDIQEIAIGGADPHDFTEVNTCSTTLPSGASCFIRVTFTPSVKGQRKASLRVVDDGGGSPQSVSLSGMGT
jgi:hypothetical protein